MDTPLKEDSGIMKWTGQPAYAVRLKSSAVDRADKNWGKKEMEENDLAGAKFGIDTLQLWKKDQGILVTGMGNPKPPYPHPAAKYVIIIFF